MIDGPEVVLAALGIVATLVGALIWIVKFLMVEIKSSLDKNSKSHDQVTKATKANTQVSQETLAFMKNLNGRLAKITAQKINEQIVEHQTVQHHDNENL